MFGTGHNRDAQASKAGTRLREDEHRNGHNGNGNGNGNGAVRTLPKPARLG
jgi:hypothetical protein